MTPDESWNLLTTLCANQNTGDFDGIVAAAEPVLDTLQECHVLAILWGVNMSSMEFINLYRPFLTKLVSLKVEFNSYSDAIRFSMLEQILNDETQ